MLRTQLQMVEVEKGQGEKQIQSLRILLQVGTASKGAICAGRDCLQVGVQAKVDQVLTLE